MTEHSRRVLVICTGKGTHGSIELAQLDVTDDDIKEVTTRRGRAPVRGNGTAREDGRQIPISIGPRMIVPVTPSRTGHGTWRWKCPKCHRDRPLTEANLRKWITLVTGNGATVLDISHLPR